MGRAPNIPTDGDDERHVGGEGRANSSTMKDEIWLARGASVEIRWAVSGSLIVVVFYAMLHPAKADSERSW
jgi:hypothetical protein